MTVWVTTAPETVTTRVEVTGEGVAEPLWVSESDSEVEVGVVTGMGAGGGVDDDEVVVGGGGVDEVEVVVDVEVVGGGCWEECQLML